MLVRRSLESRSALFAEDIGCWETQDGLWRNVCPPSRTPGRDGGAAEEALADNRFTGTRELDRVCVCVFFSLFLGGGGFLLDFRKLTVAAD